MENWKSKFLERITVYPKSVAADLTSKQVLQLAKAMPIGIFDGRAWPYSAA
ncbi:MAG TPA: hypothetical protein VN924_25915 [Bryobacteraceae bacterium]|nr:hypothetical protein [Bryobacteraceae bacterium]